MLARRGCGSTFHLGATLDSNGKLMPSETCQPAFCRWYFGFSSAMILGMTLPGRIWVGENAARKSNVRASSSDQPTCPRGVEAAARLFADADLSVVFVE